MAIQVTLEDHHGNVIHRAKISETAEISRLLPALITSLHLPLIDDGGRPIVYHLSHDGRRLQENETLQDANVQQGDTMVLVPEMTAGSQSDIVRPKEGEPLVELESTSQKHLPVAGFPSGYQVDCRTESVLLQFQSNVIEQALTQAKHYKEQEVAGMLAGTVYEEDGRFLVIIERLFEAQHTLAGLAFVTFTDKTWLDLLKQRESSPFWILGWYHSHPGFGIFLSGSDEFIHRNYFGSQPWYIALVVDPISNEWGAFTWEKGKISQCFK